MLFFLKEMFLRPTDYFIFSINHKKCDFKIAVDAVNSTGGIAVPMLLDALGVKNQELLYCEPNGDFPHNMHVPSTYIVSSLLHTFQAV